MTSPPIDAPRAACADSTPRLVTANKSPRLAPGILPSIRAGLLVLNLIVLLLCGLLLWRSWQAEMAAGETRASTTASLLERGASATFDNVRIVTHNVADQLERQLAGGGIDTASLWALVDKAAANVPEIERIGVFDARGRQVCGVPVDRCGHYDVSDRDYFTTLRQHPESPATLVGPFNSRTNNQPAVGIVRAMNTPAREFAGVVVAIVHLDHLRILLASAKVGPKGAATMRMENMQLLARSSPLPVDAERELATTVSDQFRQAQARSHESGVYRAVAAIDGVDRVIAYRKLPRYPVFVFVGEATDDFLAGWRNTALWTGVFLVLFLAATVAIERAAAASLRQQERARRLFDEAPCGYHTLDADGRYLSINATELQWLGCTRDEVIGKLRPADFFNAEGRALFAVNFPVFRRTGHLEGMEVDLVGRQGNVRRVSISGKAVADAQGRFLMSNSVMYDVSDRTQAEAARLRAAELEAQNLALQEAGRIKDEFLATFEQAAVGIAHAAPDGRFIRVNRKLCEIVGYDRAELLAKAWQDITCAEDLEVDVDPMRRLMAGAIDHYGVQKRYVRKDGSLVWVMLTVSLRRRADGTPEYFIGVIEDIDERKNTERSLHTARAEMEQMLSLHVATQTAAAIAHELNQPLNALSSYAEAALRMQKSGNPRPERLAHALTAASAQAQRAGRVVRELLQYLQRGDASREPVDVNELVQQSFAVLEADGFGGFKTKIHLARDMRRARVNRLQVEKVLVNLIRNGVEAMQAAGVAKKSIEIAIRTAESGDMALVSVTDTGPGLDPALVARVFEPFFSTKPMGIGLGLAVSRTLIEANGGRLWVDERPGPGATFHFTLPLEPAEALARVAAT